MTSTTTISLQTEKHATEENRFHLVTVTDMSHISMRLLPPTVLRILHPRNQGARCHAVLLFASTGRKL